MSVVQFPTTRGSQQPDGAGQDAADAVDRYLDSIQVATTRAELRGDPRPPDRDRRLPARRAPCSPRTTRQ